MASSISGRSATESVEQRLKRCLNLFRTGMRAMAAQRAITLALGAALGTGLAAATLTTAKPAPPPPPPPPPPAAAAPVLPDQLLQAHVVFRHGARTPLSPKYWPAWSPEWDVCGSAYAAVPIDVVTEGGANRPANPDDERQVGICVCVGVFVCVCLQVRLCVHAYPSPAAPTSRPHTGQPALRRRVQQGRADAAGPGAGHGLWPLAAAALQRHPPATSVAVTAPRGPPPARWRWRGGRE